MRRALNELHDAIAENENLLLEAAELKKMGYVSEDGSELRAKTANAEIAKATLNTTSEIRALGKEADAVTNAFSSAQGVRIFQPVIEAMNGKKVDAESLAQCAIFANQILLCCPDISSGTRNYLEVIIRKIGEDPRLNLRQWRLQSQN